MPKTSREAAVRVEDMGVMEGRCSELGGYTVGFKTSRVDADAAPILRGLPDDRCQSPHWGYVISGRLHFRFADHEETFEAGDAFYLPPGHVPFKHEPGTESVQWSPTEELRQTEAVMQRNMEAMHV
jgi:hypothetical protein